VVGGHIVSSGGEAVKEIQMANVLITGCSSGFGLLSALEFARRGHAVHATMRNLAKDGGLKAAAEKDKLDMQVRQLDVLDLASIDRCVKEASATAPIDVLVNNAGFEMRGPIEEIDEDEVKRQFDTNVFGLLRVIRAVVPAMRERGSGTVINLSSVAGIVAPPYGGMYGATKHAVECISEALYYELKPFGVRVAIVEPGAFVTGFGENIVTAKRFTADSPYRKGFAAFDVAIGGMRQGIANDPQEVANIICDAAFTEAPVLRYIAGDDGRLIAGVRKQTDFEGFETAMRQTLNWYD
jgi:NAD(P)-dependent dehydrogenase (short-subunit alcohol dehydrogenase family)